MKETLRQQVVERFREKQESGGFGNPYLNADRIEKFLLAELDSAYAAGRRDAVEFIKKNCRQVGGLLNANGKLLVEISFDDEIPGTYFMILPSTVLLEAENEDV
jgi:hypothetical protein